jgi:hypothetical protein
MKQKRKSATLPDLNKPTVSPGGEIITQDDTPRKDASSAMIIPARPPSKANVELIDYFIGERD